MRKVSALDFQLFLAKLSWARFLDGFYYFKWLEYPLVYNNLNFKRGELYLDIGSGKSIFPLFVLAKTDCIVHLIDDQSIIKDSISYYESIIKKAGLSNKLGKRLFIHKVVEGTEFEFPDNYFDKISCISTLEHIRNTGDSMVMRTISRILKKGGKAVITFPFNNGDYIEEENPTGVGYFQRRYNIAAIKSRIIDQVNLKVGKVIYFGERYTNFGKLYLQNKFKKINWLLPLFAPLLWRVCHSYEGEFHNFHEKDIDKEGVGVACITFEKGMHRRVNF